MSPIQILMNFEESHSFITKILLDHGYEMGELLGKGGFAGCFQVRRITGDFDFACKIISAKYAKKNASIDGIRSSYANELNALKALYHPNVIQIFDGFESGDFYFLILELCPNGSVKDEMKNNTNGKLGHDHRLKYSLELIDALQYLHSSNIAHHDIKPSNCLIDKVGRLKLSDFGLAQRYIGVDSSARQGTMMFLAPEVLTNSSYDPFKSDIWSLGVTLFMFIKGVLPFNDHPNPAVLHDEQKIFRMNNGKTKNPIKLAFVKVINLCLTYEPNKRGSLQQIKSLLLSASQKSNLPKLSGINDRAVPKFQHRGERSMSLPKHFGSKLTHITSQPEIAPPLQQQSLLVPKIVCSNPIFDDDEKSIEIEDEDKLSNDHMIKIPHATLFPRSQPRNESHRLSMSLLRNKRVLSFKDLDIITKHVQSADNFNNNDFL